MREGGRGERRERERDSFPIRFLKFFKNQSSVLCSSHSLLSVSSTSLTTIYHLNSHYSQMNTNLFCEIQTCLTLSQRHFLFNLSKNQFMTTPLLKIVNHTISILVKAFTSLWFPDPKSLHHPWPFCPSSSISFSFRIPVDFAIYFLNPFLYSHYLHSSLVYHQVLTGGSPCFHFPLL